MSVAITAVAVLLFVGISRAEAAVYTQNFDTLSLSTIAGQDGWTSCTGGFNLDTVFATANALTSPNGYSLGIGGANHCAPTTFPSQDFYVKFGYYHDTAINNSATAVNMFGFSTSSHNGNGTLNFGITTGRVFEALDQSPTGLGVVGSTTSNFFSAGWHEIEIYGEGGVMTVVVDDVPEMTFSYVPAYIDRFYFGSSGGWFTNNIFFDDFEIRTDTDVPAAPVFPGFDSTYNTRFSGVVFDTSTSSGSTTLTFTPSYIIDLDEINTNDPKFNPSQVTVGIAKQPSTQISTIGNSILPLTATGSTTIQFDDVEDGVYDFLVRFWNLSASFDESKQPFDKSYIYGQLTIVGGVITSSQVDELYDGTQPPTAQKQPCGITSIDGCIYNAMVSAFVPSSDSVGDVLAISTTLEGKFPFAYAYDFYEVSANLYNSSTTQSLGLTLPFGDLGSTTIISTAQLEAVPFASTLRSIIAGLLWAMFAFLVYRRTLLIFNKA